MRTASLVRASLAAGLIAIVLAAATGASACFPLPVLSVQPRASGPAGARVTVSGVDMGEGATEVRWNAIDGPLLGRGGVDTFNVEVTIPQAADGVYAIVALARRTDDSIGVKVVTPFQVGADAGPRAGAEPPSAAAGTSAHSSPTASLSTAATVGLALGGLAVALVGGVAGAALTRGRHAGPGPPPDTT